MKIIYKIAKNNNAKIIIVHGWGGSPLDDFFPWLKKEAEKIVHNVIIPRLPNTYHPEILPWINTLKKACGTVDKNTYFIGHSLGCSAILRLLKILPKTTKVGGVILLAGGVYFTDVSTWKDGKDGDQEIVDKWLDFEFNLKDVIEKTVLILSDDDPYIPVRKNAKTLKERLNAKVIIEHNKGHYTSSDGVKEVPTVFSELSKMINSSN